MCLGLHSLEVCVCVSIFVKGLRLQRPVASFHGLDYPSRTHDPSSKASGTPKCWSLSGLQILQDFESLSGGDFGVPRLQDVGTLEQEEVCFCPLWLRFGLWGRSNLPTFLLPTSQNPLIHSLAWQLMSFIWSGIWYSISGSTQPT